MSYLVGINATGIRERFERMHFRSGASAKQRHFEDSVHLKGIFREAVEGYPQLKALGNNKPAVDFSRQ